MLRYKRNNNVELSDVEALQNRPTKAGLNRFLLQQIFLLQFSQSAISICTKISAPKVHSWGNSKLSS